jgi:hypothetical protein
MRFLVRHGLNRCVQCPFTDRFRRHKLYHNKVTNGYFLETRARVFYLDGIDHEVIKKKIIIIIEVQKEVTWFSRAWCVPNRGGDDDVFSRRLVRVNKIGAARVSDRLKLAASSPHTLASSRYARFPLGRS